MDIAIKKAKDIGIGWVSCRGKCFVDCCNFWKC